MKLITVAGLPSSGKTSVIIHLIKSLNEDGNSIPAVCVIDNLSGINTPRKIGPMLKLADIVVITKGDIVSHAEREVFSFNVRQVNSKAKIIFINGITGQGTFLLKKYLSVVKDIKTLRNKLLRFTTPASVCSYCTGEMRIGESHQMGMLKKMEFDYDE